MFCNILTTNERINNEEILNDIKVLGDYILEYFKNYPMITNYSISKIIVDNTSFYCDIEKKESIDLNQFMLNKNVYEFKLNEKYIEQQSFPFISTFSHIDNLIDELFEKDYQNDQAKIKRLITVISHNYNSKYFLADKNQKYHLIGNDIDKLIVLKISWSFNIQCNNISVNYEENLSLIKEHFNTSIYDCLEGLYIVKNTYLLYDNDLVSPKKFNINTIETKLFSIVSGKDCCVCLEQTNGITTCGHSICLPCRIKTLHSKNKSKCPICRNKCLDNIVDDDSNDSDDE